MLHTILTAIVGALFVAAVVYVMWLDHIEAKPGPPNDAGWLLGRTPWPGSRNPRVFR